MFWQTDLGINILAGACIALLGYLFRDIIGRIQFHRYRKSLATTRTLEDAITISPTTFVFGNADSMTLYIRPLAETTLQNYISDPILIEELKKAATKVQPGKPLIAVQDPAFQELTMKKIIGALNNAGDSLAVQMLDAGEEFAECLIALIKEPDVRNPMLRIMIFRESDARAALIAYAAHRLHFERPHYEKRIETISRIIENWDAHPNKDCDECPVRRFVVGHRNRRTS